MKKILGLVMIGICFVSYGKAQVIRYDFNEASGSYSNSGTAGGTANILGTGAFGADGSGVSGLAGDRSYNNNTTGGAVEHSVDVEAIDTATSFTITGWYNSANIFAELNTGSRIYQDNGFILFGNNDGGTGGGLLLQMLDGSVTNLSSNFSGPGTGYQQDNTWVYFAVSWDGSDVNFYSGSDTTATVAQGTSAFTSAGLNNGTTEPIIGNRPNLNRAFVASFDDFRIYDSALSAGAIEGVRLEAIPEPSTYALLLAGMGTLYLLRRKKAEAK